MTNLGEISHCLELVQFWALRKLQPNRTMIALQQASFLFVLLFANVSCKDIAARHFPIMPDLPSDGYDLLSNDHFVLVSETNLTSKREKSLIVEDEIGEPLGEDDEIFSGKISDEPTYSGYEVDPSQGDLFEGDISGVELKAAEDKVEGQLSFERVIKHITVVKLIG